MTPQMLLKIRFSELAEGLKVRISVRRRTDKFYLTITGSWEHTERFMRTAFPGAWVTSAAGDECVYGLPMDEVTRALAEIPPDGDWWPRRDSTAWRIAQGIREDRAFERLPILADALEEAGCNNAAILEHCRAPGKHGRCCWVVDLLLGK